MSPVLRHAITPALCLQFASLGELMGGVTGRKSLCVSGAGTGHYRCRPAWRCSAAHGDRFILYAISVCRKYDFSGLWWCLIDRWSVPMLYNPAPTLFRLILSVTCLLFIAGYGYATLSQPPEVNLLARHLSPDIQHWFGTDNLGRDVWLRCFQGPSPVYKLALAPRCAAALSR